MLLHSSSLSFSEDGLAVKINLSDKNLNGRITLLIRLKFLYNYETIDDYHYSDHKFLFWASWRAHLDKIRQASLN